MISGFVAPQSINIDNEILPKVSTKLDGQSQIERIIEPVSVNGAGDGMIPMFIASPPNDLFNIVGNGISAETSISDAVAQFGAAVGTSPFYIYNIQIQMITSTIWKTFIWFSLINV